MGALSRCWREWEKIGTPPHVKTWIQEGVYIPFNSTPEACYFKNPKMSPDEASFIDSKINELLDKSYISEVLEKPHCVSPLKCVPKKNSNDKFRLIHNMRYVNQFIQVPNVRYEDLSMLPNVVRKNDCYASMDLKDGFHHIKIKNEFRKYFGFQWRNQFFVWNVLSFGCSISPYFFTKILRPVVQYLRDCGIRLILYVDDFLICSAKNTILSNIELVKDTLTDLGWTINIDKSQLSPVISIEYLGLILENDCDGNPHLKVTKKKISKLKKDINRILKLDFVSARVLSKIAGQCNFICKAVLPGRLMLRNIYKLIRCKSTWESQLQLTESAISDLRWWLTAFDAWNGRLVLPTEVQAQLVTDASHYGWGAHLGEHQTHGSWDHILARQHSNVRELTAVLMALRAFRPFTKDKRVIILSDNISTVAYINHMGGPVTQLTEIAKQIWAEAISYNVTILARHLSGKMNVQADSLSRLLDKHEWALARPTFKYLDATWGPHTVDRFASATTTQLPIYNARYLDPNHMQVDALAQQDWKRNNNFVNGPFRLLDRILAVIEDQEAHATVIAPYWPAQPWCQKLMNLSITTPIRISRKSIIQLNPAIPEPLRNPKWKIFAWRLCGNPKHTARGGRFGLHHG